MWDFARSAEAMFSRWAFKRACKFLLKKRLGDFILGDIDLDQLDVQLSRGTIQLSDLALNVDFLNQKLSGAAVMIKEGSIASLSVKFPWKLQNCEIEVEELELVLAPFVERNSPTDADCVPDDDGNGQMQIDSEKILIGTPPSNSGSISRDIHEGAKTIATFVKWFLTSFHVRLKNLIIAFDPCSATSEKRSVFHRSLILRIAETEFGACVSEIDTTVPNSKLDSLLGIAKLTNFMKFKGAVVEFLQMDDVDNRPQIHSDLGTSFSEWCAGSLPLGTTTTILTGASGGFSGKLNLNIPWKNGSLDIHKVDADVSIDPVELQIQPSTIEWIIVVWEYLKNIGMTGRSHVHCNSVVEYTQSSTTGPAVLDSGMPSRGNLSKSIYTTVNQETFPDSLPPRTHVIHNWVPQLTREDGQTELEPDYGASIDQFFECFDGIRSSQVSSGNSGIWNWTCSVFSAITVASNLASGSGHIPPEQQHVETNLRATIAEVSVILSFHDDGQKHSHDTMSNGKHNFSASNIINLSLDRQSSDPYMSCLSSMNIEHSTINEINSINIDIEHLEARCQNAVLNLQICPQKITFDASVTHVKIDEYYDNRDWAKGFGFSGNINTSYDQMILKEHLQGQVQCVLPQFSSSARVHNSETSIKEDTSQDYHNASFQDVREVVLESFGECSCKYAAITRDLDSRSMTSSSFSVHLPPLILWVRFRLINVWLNFFKQVEKYFEKSKTSKDFASDALDKRYKSSSPDDVNSGTSTYITTVSPRTNLQGSIVLHQARVIICFPSEYHGLKQSTSSDKFIILEHSPSLGLEKVSDAFLISKASSPKSNSSTPFTSIHLSVGNFDIYLADSADKDTLGDKFCTLEMQPLSTVKILSVISGTNHQSGVTMLWQKGPVTGPWMASRAWSLATSHEQRSRCKVTREGCEFSSVTTAEGLEQTSSHIRQELILSSTFFLHVHLSLVQFNLGNNDYKLLNHLLNQVMDVLSNEAHYMNITANESIKNEHSYSGDAISSQSSILVDCDVMDLCISLDSVAVVNDSMQKELPGSWNSLKLTIEKLEFLSVSNIGGINNANFVWLNHGEGELWGSIFDRNEKASPVTQEFLLITCRNSTIGRGAGGGDNALSFGSAGTAITHMSNPQLFQSYTSVIVQFGTIIAPGGRLDWINAICLYFNLSHENEPSDNDGMQSKSSADDLSYKASFFLDLVDIALSYEPQMKCSTNNGQDSFIEYSGAVESNEETGEPYVACLLAAASLSLSSHTMANSATVDYDIHLQDAGLLISESSASKNGSVGYHASYLKKIGYVKVAEEPLIQAVLRIEGPFWEIECSESHINFETCHDSTYGLFCLVAQLQQLYAPDVEDALAHLQSRWSTIQQVHNENISNDVADISDSISVRSSSDMKLPNSEESCRSLGLMDEIVENAFYLNGECGPSSDHCNISHSQQERGMLVDSCNLNVSTSAAGDAFVQRILLEKSIYDSGTKRIQKSSVSESCSPLIIDSYYVSESLRPSKLNAGNHSVLEGHKGKFDISAQRDIECGKGGWYRDGSFTIVENHISKVSNLPVGEQLHEGGKLLSVDSNPAYQRRERGRIVIKNTNVRWRMYAGLDWYKPAKTSMCNSNSNGRDKSGCLELILSGLNVRYDAYPEGEISLSKLSLSIQDINLYDRGRDAPWMMVLGYYNSKDHPRESCAKAFVLDLEAVRPDPLIPLEDYRLRLEFLPMRLHLDQGQLNFLISFFGNNSFAEESPSLPNNLGGSEMSGRKKTFGSQTIEEEALLPFFQKCDIMPVVVRVDYIPRYVDLAAFSRGNYAELLNLAPWKGIDLQLKHVCAVGVYGWSSVCETVVGEWLEDISHNQVHKLLKGLAPIRSLFAVSSGTSKLVSLPVRSFKKDRKLLKGMQRGTSAFFRSILLEVSALGVHLAAGAHEMLIQTEYMLASIPPSIPLSEKDRAKKFVRSIQPEDAQQGIQQAYESLSDGFGRTASALLVTPLKAYQRGAGAGSALATAVRSIPAAAIAPVSASARAVHCALLGVRNSLDHERKKESMVKYHGPSQS